MKPRPTSVTVISGLLVAAGAIGIAYHLTEIKGHPFRYEILWISLVRLVAIVSGVYMLRGSNWARWLALLWIAFHVLVSVFHSLGQFAIHALLLAACAYFLFRAPAARFFQAARTPAA